MKTTKRIISSSAKNSAVMQQILADKKALRDHCASMVPVISVSTNGKETVQSVSVQ